VIFHKGGSSGRADRIEPLSRIRPIKPLAVLAEAIPSTERSGTFP
jgi:hypothetical protein